ncbi:MAG TPA: squalene synthase HpnC [Pirellulales bacterium]|jgi:squalene synthase HpnC|nr:squalene synthase HpnC [Pirellulales bacterium]
MSAAAPPNHLRIDDLQHGAELPIPTLPEAREYCRRLARTHYENFTVASWLLPRGIRPHFYSIYAYCRTADDLADETGDAARSLVLLDQWEAQLRACYAGSARHPVFVALAETIAEFAIPIEPFADLLSAFRQDQCRTHYGTFDELLDYCRRSANPVGRLVLHLGRCCDEANAELADHVCTGLQLANFWQDVARDYDRGRMYLPRETCREFGYDDAQLATRSATAAFRQALEFEVNRAERFLRAGLPLVERVPRWLAGDVWLFVHGGLRILDHLRRLDYDVWNARPVVSRREQFALLLGWFWQRLRSSRSHCDAGTVP